MRRRVPVGRRGSGGFTFLWVLFAVALTATGVLVVSEVSVGVARRQVREQQEWAGQQYVQAIASYYEGTPGGGKVYPPSLQVLLEDGRFPVRRRHLRQLYADPWTGSVNWETVHCGAGICGVLSSDKAPWGARLFRYPSP